MFSHDVVCLWWLSPNSYPIDPCQFQWIWVTLKCGTKRVKLFRRMSVITHKQFFRDQICHESTNGDRCGSIGSIRHHRKGRDLASSKIWDPAFWCPYLWSVSSDVKFRPWPRPWPREVGLSLGLGLASVLLTWPRTMCYPMQNNISGIHFVVANLYHCNIHYKDVVKHFNVGHKIHLYVFRPRRFGLV